MSKKRNWLLLISIVLLSSLLFIVFNNKDASDALKQKSDTNLPKSTLVKLAQTQKDIQTKTVSKKKFLNPSLPSKSHEGHGYSSFLKNKQISKLKEVLKESKGLSEFRPGENPAGPGCFEGVFNNYKVFLFVSGNIPQQSIQTMHSMDFRREEWKLGSSSYLEITADDGKTWASRYKENEAFILRPSQIEAGLLFNVEDSFVIQLFSPKEAKSKIAYFGNVYIKSEEQKMWTLFSTVELVQPQSCTGK